MADTRQQRAADKTISSRGPPARLTHLDLPGHNLTSVTGRCDKPIQPPRPSPTISCACRPAVLPCCLSPVAYLPPVPSACSAGLYRSPVLVLSS